MFACVGAAETQNNPKSQEKYCFHNMSPLKHSSNYVNGIYIEFNLILHSGISAAYKNKIS